MTDMDAKEVAHESLYGDGQEGDVYMNVTRYMADAARTASGNFHADLVVPSTLIDAINEVQISAQHVDKIKKALFYGKEDADLAFVRSLKESESYGSVEVDLIHAILGIYTEAAELLEILGVALMNKDTPLSYEENGELENKIINEAGDGLWYHAMLYRLLGTDFDEVSRLNIEKLKKRFPVKFSEDLAVNRDEAAENVVFN